MKNCPDDSEHELNRMLLNTGWLVNWPTKRQQQPGSFSISWECEKLY